MYKGGEGEREEEAIPYNSFTLVSTGERFSLAFHATAVTEPRAGANLNRRRYN